MTRTTDGFELADEDLRLRGEGTLFDTTVGDADLGSVLSEDLDLVKRARARAFALIEGDPALEVLRSSTMPCPVRGLPREPDARPS